MRTETGIESLPLGWSKRLDLQRTVHCFSPLTPLEDYDHSPVYLLRQCDVLTTLNDDVAMGSPARRCLTHPACGAPP